MNVVRRLGSPWAAMGAMVLGTIALLLSAYPWHVTRSLEVGKADSWGGNAYAVQVAPLLPSGWMAALLGFAPDSNETPRASRLRVLEQGRDLGPAHSIHADISANGGGRFSHWGATLVFSASDNSKPATNGRAYSLSYPVAPPAWIGYVLLVAGALALAVRLARASARAHARVGAAILALGIAASIWNVFPIHREVSIDPGAIAQHDRQRYFAHVGPRLPQGLSATLIGFRPDDIGQNFVSPLRLLEQGRRIGLPHTNHEEIATAGAGRYSHWTEHLFFSSSDHSNPAANGRAYAITYPVAPARWICLALLVIGFGWLATASLRKSDAPATQGRLDTILRAVRGKSSVVFWVAIGVLWLYANVVYASLLVAPVPAPDSHGYLLWSLFRTPGYSFLLHGYHWLTGSWAGLGLFQLNLILAGLAILAWGVARCTRSHLLAWLVVALVFGLGSIFGFAADVLTEPPFTAFAMAHAGFVMLYFADGRRWQALLAGVFLGCAILVKSVAVVLLGPLLLLVLFLRGHRKAIAALVLAPAFAAWIAPSLANLVRNGFFESSIAGGYALIGHVAWAIEPAAGSRHEAEMAAIQRRLQPILAKRPAAFATLDEYVNYTANEYNTLLWRNIVPELADMDARRHPNAPPDAGCTWRSCNAPATLRQSRQYVAISREAIAAHPGAYAWHVFAHDYGLWRDSLSYGSNFLTAINTRAEHLHSAYDPAVSAYAQILAPLPPLKSFAERTPIVARFDQSAVRRALDLATVPELAEWLGERSAKNPWPLIVVSLVASALLAFGSRLPPAGVAFSYCALCVNAYFLGTALAQPSLVRYAWTMQGLIGAMLVLGLFLLATLAAAGVRRLRVRAAARGV